MMRSMSDLRELVRAERRRRGWSVRKAASTGGCSNTAWGEWENGARELGQAVQAGISQAFDWAPDWPDHPPTVSAGGSEGAAAAAAEWRRKFEALEARVAQ